MIELREKAAADLEWAQLLVVLAGHCVVEQAAERILHLKPATELADACLRNARCGQAIEALAQAEPIPSQAVPDILPMLERTGRSGVAAAEELAELVKLLVQARTLRNYAKGCRVALPLVAAAIDSPASLESLRAELERCIEPGGRIADSASSELRAARQSVASCQRRLAEKLKKLQARYADVLREGSYVVREGRYGLPVRADAHRRVEGIVLGGSATGATLYVEPPAVTAQANQLRIAEGQVEREEARILASLSARVCEHQEAVEVAIEACIEADVLAALARWAQRNRAVSVVPDERARVSLRQVRHPLLEVADRPVVANDIVLEAGQALIISGPNAGGKTVALKCLGLAVWMTRAGVPLPAAPETRVGWFDDVLTDIGDEQSIARSLSSFSAEVMLLGAMLEQAGPRSMILLDELAGGTDPEEGSALAEAVLDALLARGAAVAVTTHYERLKELASSSTEEGAGAPRYENASVGFNFDEMQPTFTLKMGLPGPSSALAVALRHGLPKKVVDRARSLLSSATRDREQLLAQLAREHQALVDARAAAELDAEQAALEREASEAERLVVRQKERKRLQDEAAELTARVRDARANLRALSGDLKRGESATVDLRSAQRMVDEAAKVVSIGGPLAKSVREPDQRRRVERRELVVGTRVYVPRIGAVAEIIEAPDRGQVRVQAGSMSLRVAIKDLRFDAAPPAPAEKKTRQPKATARRATEREIRTSANTCDLRGQRADEAVENVDRFIDRCISHSDSPAFVLHGHGTGALRRAVRDHLSESIHVGRSRPATTDEGGDAFTVFWLRD